MAACSSGPRVDANGKEIFSARDVYYGSRMSQAECDQLMPETHMWVDGECLRYYAAGLKKDGQNPVVIGFLSGDLIAAGNSAVQCGSADHLSSLSCGGEI